MIPPAILGYFWLIVAAGMLANVAVVHARAGALVRTGQLSEAERRAFSRGAAVVVVVFCLLLQAIVWLTGERRPECLAAFPPATAGSWASSVVTFGAWSALLWWVWRSAGAERLARFSPAFGVGRASRSYSAAQVRRAVTIIVIVAGLGGAVASRVVPPPADCGHEGGRQQAFRMSARPIL